MIPHTKPTTTPAGRCQLAAGRLALWYWRLNQRRQGPEARIRTAVLAESRRNALRGAVLAFFGLGVL